MYLVDTNIFLEILLEQAKKGVCKHFLNTHIGDLYISDFSLHSIGVILFRNEKEKVFQQFTQDVLPKTQIITLAKHVYQELVENKRQFGLDFDDTYQFSIAKESGFTLVTMDGDFKGVQQSINVIFL
jgi:predicted nucleic acid-binding protein